MGEAFLRSGTISNARPPERGCIATVLLAADGDLIASEPGGVAFPARALTAAQRALRQSTDTAQLTVHLDNHAVEICRLADGLYLANLFARERSEPAYSPAVAPLAVVRRSVRPSLAKSKEVAALTEPWEPGVVKVNVLVTPEPAQATAAAGPPTGPAFEPAAAEREETAAPAVAEPAARGPEPNSPAGSNQRPKAAEAAGPTTPEKSAPIQSWPMVPVQPPGQARPPDRRPLVAILLLAGALLVAGFFAWRVGLRPSGGSAPAVGATPPGSRAPTAAPSPSIASAPSPTPSPAPSPAVQLTYGRSLARGDSGGDVRALQERLRQLRYFTYPVDTGYFGDATYGAVFTFQQRQGLPTSGVADHATVNALNSCDHACAY